MKRFDRRQMLRGTIVAAPVLALSASALDAGQRPATSTVPGAAVPPEGTVVTPPLPATLQVSVADHGAKGDGTTDDTAAIVAARDAVLATRVNDNQLAAELFFPAGIYRITTPDALLASPTDGSADQVRGYTVRGMGKRTSEIFFDSDAGETDDPFAHNLMTAANRIRAMRVSSISFRSENANQSWMYCWSRDDGDKNLEQPDVGSGSNHDVVLSDVEWRGAWKRVIGLDGDQQSNLNSEWAFYSCHVNNTGTFADAFLHCGMSPEHDQQDQFLNFWFYACKFEYAHGTLLKFSKGGFINVFGGSWIAGINSDEPATFFHMPATSHFDSTQNLVVVGTRFELRHHEVTLLDTAWGGPSAHITFQNISDSALSFQPWAADTNPVLVRSESGSIPTLKFLNSELMGYHRVLGAKAGQGRVVYDGCNFANHPGGGVGDDGFLRYAGGQPSYRFVDCYGVEDDSA